MSSSLKKIKQVFDKKYAAWGIALPDESLKDQARGSVSYNGWTINYQFGTEHGQRYLEYFASHRMTNDTLNRIYADGREEVLGYCQEFYLAGNPKAEQDSIAHNRGFYEIVKSKGLW
jgi:hypothetical protein